MQKVHYKIDPWKIIENDFDSSKVKASESIFSLGNGYMGHRANFEEHYSGTTFQGSYIGGIYYPDKTKVGWWKNGYPEYFAKVLNSPSWIGIHININGFPLDLNKCLEVSNFKRILDMKSGIYIRSFEAQLTQSSRIAVEVKRFLSMDKNELGVINYKIKSLQGKSKLTIESFIDGNIKNEDSNWSDPFWKHGGSVCSEDLILLNSQTLKTKFDIATYAHTELLNHSGDRLSKFNFSEKEFRISQTKEHDLNELEHCTILKYGGYINGLNHNRNKFEKIAENTVKYASEKGYKALEDDHRKVWLEIWDQSDIEIVGDDKAQQGIRFNIFQLNQTYDGRDSRLNIGPKGFTGEKYGGSTYWDTEAYCLPFYMATKSHKVARNLLKYRYDHLEKAIENAEKLGFKNGSALYPMVTMNGEECHNEWEITFEEIHRNGAIAYAIFNYERFTGDLTYIPEMGLEVLIAISRFWAERVNYSENKKAYVILGVTGPNEYENNVNNNWYTNYLAQWCLLYTTKEILKIKKTHPQHWNKIKQKVSWQESEIDKWNQIATQIHFPRHPENDIFLQQDGFLDKTIIPASSIDKSERPINQHWSWDRILRSPFIKQADVLQGLYLFEENFDYEFIKKHFDFYEPLTVHESSLSACVHSILASRLGRIEKAYSLYLRTSRLDLDDYNKEVEEGLHITSMAGTWMSLVQGFGGVRIINDQLHIDSILPKSWEKYNFKINYRNTSINVEVDKKKVNIIHSNPSLAIYCHGELVNI